MNDNIQMVLIFPDKTIICVTFLNGRQLAIPSPPCL